MASRSSVFLFPLLVLPCCLTFQASQFQGLMLSRSLSVSKLLASAPAPRTKLSLRGGGEKMGVEVVTERQGDGKTFPKKGDMLTMHYLGTLSNGNKFDSSYDRGSPFKFQIGVGQVIKGWDEGVMQMSLGEKARLKISPDFGYGERGFPPVIPPSSNLVFDVELLGINNQQA